LELVEVPDISVDGAFDRAVEGWTPRHSWLLVQDVLTDNSK
jgi:hypothetical protein